MIDYRCPSCNWKQFEAESVVPVLIRIKCRTCRRIVTPVHGKSPVLHRTYECSSCHRVQYCERPKNQSAHCVVCGTATLTIVAETQESGRPVHGQV